MLAMLLYIILLFSYNVQATIFKFGTPRHGTICRSTPSIEPLDQGYCFELVHWFNVAPEWRSAPPIWNPATPSKVKDPFSPLYWSLRYRNCALTITVQRLRLPNLEATPVWRPTEYEWWGVSQHIVREAEALCWTCTNDRGSTDKRPSGYGGTVHFEIEKNPNHHFLKNVVYHPGAPPPGFEIWITLHDARETFGGKTLPIQGVISQTHGLAAI
jgi:hypothetical protein